MKVKSYGKINLALDVINKREDGYHNIKTIMQKISLYDEMEFKKGSGGIVIDSNLTLKLEENLIYKSWAALCQYVGEELPLEVRLKKNLPLASGLAGGTGNGALTLKALNELYNLKLSLGELQSMSLKLGADFPYMLQGGTVLAEGIGEKLKTLKSFNEIEVLIVNPGYEISTKEVYENLDLSSRRINFKKIIDLMEENSPLKLRGVLENKMEDYVFKRHLDIKEIKTELESMGAASLMSGTGATVFGLFEDSKTIRKAFNKFKGKYPYTFMAHTLGGEDDI
ncbi:4-(cytidine 5'-diphospho)-2-C-methyl-D-erythritol kinase [Anaerosphaera multitolerans]|uniref:4-diphosphocytidyl-2-C-methyl-D-erythritol kinase n=1 Tax=Anaerosphaera multitolerans TaxID=2487351 RepID=A0A437S7P9_9FIRM|nr:4-(cytidine 5'-diphospho)-2-C-methyl-D-erythritol kinase [Anaerosphaera multitolerans]RVU55119.1 4-(cytidine 5'-diphospho)-2-C-methyl-D-erythritol kinase [Anaerosphaera multitolerans]